MAGVLIVDDDKLIRLSLKDCLDEASYKVWLAEDGATALELLGDERFDLVLLDYQLPDMDGFEVLRRIRASHLPTALRVIMLTGLDRRDHTRRRRLLIEEREKALEETDLFE